MSSEPVFLISVGRSGTHMLRGFLKEGFSTTDFGEIFNVDGPTGDHGYFPFLLEGIRSDPEAIVPLREVQEQRFDDFIGRLSEAADTPYFVVDVKYAQTHLLNGFWHQTGSVPHLIEFIKSRNYRVLHLVRRNVLATHASLLLAQSSGQYVSYTSWDKPVFDRKLTVDTATLREALTHLLMCIRFFNGCFSGYPRVLGMYYEDLLRDGKLCVVHARHLARFLEQPEPPPLLPATRKLAPNLVDLVSNYDEVMSELAGTPFAELARS